ncbi:hypothetical protein D9M68_751360 [compost metagenome]
MDAATQLSSSPGLLECGINGICWSYSRYPSRSSDSDSFEGQIAAQGFQLYDHARFRKFQPGEPHELPTTTLHLQEASRYADLQDSLVS